LLSGKRSREERLGVILRVRVATAQSTQIQCAAAFLALHYGDRALLLANPWDQGSAKLFATLGFQALATTSGDFAASLGRLDGHVTRDEALRHAALIAAATELPLSADLESGFADD
jgi:2-methylisocitrate lyase-like PEP mutase family enzyme